MLRIYLGLTALLLFLLTPALALAADSSAPPLDHSLLLTSTQFYAAVVGALVPGVTYLLNHYAPWTSDQVKSIVLVVVAAAGGAITQLVDSGGSLAFDTNTLQVVGSAMFLAFVAHQTFWKPTGFAAALKAGTNRQDA